MHLSIKTNDSPWLPPGSEMLPSSLCSSPWPPNCALEESPMATAKSERDWEVVQTNVPIRHSADIFQDVAGKAFTMGPSGLG